MDPLIRRGAEDIYLGLKDIGRGGKFDQIILTEIPLGEFFWGCGGDLPMTIKVLIG